MLPASDGTNYKQGFMLCSSAPDLDPPSFRESSTDTSTSSSSGLLAPSATSLNVTKDMLPPLTSKAFEEESLSSFDWTKWEDWMQWDEDNIVAKSPALQTASPSVSHLNPSLSPTSNNRDISNNQNSINVQPSLGFFQMPTDATNPFAPKEMPFEYASDQPLTAFNNELQLPIDLTEPTGVALHSKSFPLEQFQFGGISDACSSLPLEQPPAQNLFLDSFVSSASDCRRSVSISSPESNLSGQSRKRKSSIDDEDTDLAHTKPKRVLGAKEAHKVVEKKYRMNLNEKIAELRDSIPSFQRMNKDSQGNIDDEDEYGNFDGESRQAGKPNKGLVLSKATEYIRHLEKRNKKLNKEIAIMKIQLNAFKTLAMAGSMGLRNGAMQNPTSGQMYANETRQPYQANPQSDVQAVSQTQNLSPRVQPIVRRGSGGGGGGYMSKLMVGSLAGLMILQGFSEKEQIEENPSGRGLFALPTGYLSSMGHILHSTHQSNAIGYMPLFARPLVLFKAVLLIGAILYLISPSFFDAKPKEKPNPMSNVELTAAPSLASPLEVRRSAWLTAIQTVWVPRQSFLLQIAALVLKSLKLFLRNTIGWQRYAMLTGATEDQEAARVKAWEIALDAQLAGGDAEISTSRLILTMMASGTLPETPYRLMLKALHIHILLWEVAHSRLWGRYLYRSFAARFARYQWGKARKLQKKINSLRSSNETSGSDTLPDYLAHLLELDSDAIMADVVVQRAYNLAWNKPTADKVVDYVDAMDSIVDDPAIRSPLDALAAWYSSLVLHEVLIISLEATTGTADQKVAIQDGLEVALKIAPTASLVQSRAISARAVLLDQGRGANIAAALQALPMLSLQPVNNTLTTLESVPSSLIKSLTPDPALAIQCAMSIALFKRPKYIKAAIAFPQQIRFSHDALGLLGFTAMYNFLAVAFQDKDVANEIGDVLENVARALKMWMGRKQNENSELEAMVNVATLCVNVFNWLVGMSGDCSDSLGLRDGK